MVKTDGKLVLWAGLGSLAVAALLAIKSNGEPLSHKPLPAPAEARPKRGVSDRVAAIVGVRGRAWMDGQHLVVECREFIHPYDINARLRWVTAIADADALSAGEARMIFFYDPNGKKFAQADPLRGVRLLD